MYVVLRVYLCVCVCVCVCVCACACVCSTHLSICTTCLKEPVEARRGVESPGPRVTGSYLESAGTKLERP